MKSKILMLLAVVIVLPMGASAIPVQVGLGAFGAGATTYSFGNDGSSPSIPGITFLGGYQEPPSVWGAASAPAYNSLAFDQLTVTFVTPVQMVGFYFGGNTPNTVPLDIGLGGATTGNFTLQTTGTSFAMPADGVHNWIFYGFQDVAGIDSLTFHSETSEGWTVGIGELITSSAAVPEPTSLLLLGTGLAGISLAAWRRKK